MVRRGLSRPGWVTTAPLRYTWSSNRASNRAGTLPDVFVSKEDIVWNGTSRREFMAGVAAIGWGAAFADLSPQNALPPKSPIGIGGAAMGALNRGLPGVFEGLRLSPIR